MPRLPQRPDLTLRTALTRWQQAVDKGLAQYDNPGFNTKTSAGNYIPLYSTDQDVYANWWSGALQTTNTGGDEPKPAKTTVFKMRSDQQYDFSSYGLTEGKFKADVFVAEPFFYWGSTAGSTKQEAWTSYKEDNVQECTIEMFSWVQPLLVPIDPG